MIEFTQSNAYAAASRLARKRQELFARIGYRFIATPFLGCGIAWMGLAFGSITPTTAEEPCELPQLVAVRFEMLEEEGQQELLPVPSADADQERRARLQNLLQRGDGANDVDVDNARRERLKELLKPRESSQPADVPPAMKTEPPPEKKWSLDVEPKSENKKADASSEDQFAEPFIPERLPEVRGGTLRLPEIRAVSTATEPIGNGRLPKDFVAQNSLATIGLPEDVYSRGLPSAGAVLPWAAPNTFSHPLYFEDRMLERHGHERWGCMQPIASGARFFTTLPMLPYLATIQEPCDIVYSQGYYRAGSPTPRFYQRPPYERRAIVVEAAAVSGAFIALP